MVYNQAFSSALFYFYSADNLRVYEGKLPEIDGMNKRGFGYAALMRRILDAALPHGSFLPGVSSALAWQMRHYAQDEALFMIAPGRERYYRPWFAILKEALRNRGVETAIVYERDMLRILKDREGKRGLIRPALPVLDWPFLDHSVLNEGLREGFIRGNLHFFLPPKPFFSSKMLLALLRNEGGGEGVEEALLDYIPQRSLGLVRRYIPRTYVLENGSEWWWGR
jgi:hypothetical protein